MKMSFSQMILLYVFSLWDSYPLPLFSYKKRTPAQIGIIGRRIRYSLFTLENTLAGWSYIAK